MTMPNGSPTSSADEQPPNGLPPPVDQQRPTETGGQKGPEPTRYGDWEKDGICSDF